MQSSDVIALWGGCRGFARPIGDCPPKPDRPSLNLVRNAEGTLESRDPFERAAKTPVAPTGKAGTKLSRLPLYRGRSWTHQFEIRAGKETLRLDRSRLRTLAGFGKCLGHAPESSTVRTDSNLTDTGLARAERFMATRREPLRNTGEVYRAVGGSAVGSADKADVRAGQRIAGQSIRVSATLSGTPQDLQAAADAWIQDFRRYDIAGGNAMRLAAQLQGSLQHIRSTLFLSLTAAPRLEMAASR